MNNELLTLFDDYDKATRDNISNNDQLLILRLNCKNIEKLRYAKPYAKAMYIEEDVVASDLFDNSDFIGFALDNMNQTI